MRKLLDTKAVAEKLGRSADWFTRNKADLYRLRFPRPVFGDQKFGRPRWDEAAIDAWLDMQMSADLREASGIGRITSTATKDIQAELAARLQKIGAPA